MNKPEQFREALASLAVTSRRDDDTFVVSIDLAPIVPLAGVRFANASVLEFRLSPTHELVVVRPPGAVVTRTKIWLQDARSYRWHALAPRPPRFSPPGARTGVFARRRAEVMDSAPVTAVLRRAAHEASVFETCRSDAEKTADRLWKDVWAAIGPELDQDALRQAARFDLPWGTYRDLMKRPDLRAFLDSAPGIGPRFRQLPEGMKWENMVSRLLGFSREKRNDDGSYDHYEYGREPAFQTWVRNVPWSKALVPVFRLSDEVYRGRVTDPAWELMQELAIAASRDEFEVEEIERLGTEDEWLLFHTAVVRMRGSGLVKQVLADPAAALRAFERTFPRERGARARWMAENLKTLIGLESDLFSAELVLKRLAERTGEPEIPWTQQGTNASRLDVVLRRVRRARALRNRMGLARMTNEAHFAVYAPPSIIARVIADEEFAWSDAVVAALISRRSCRTHPLIQKALLSRVKETAHLKLLLKDARVADVRPIWTRLAQKSRLDAVEYLEAHGFEAQAGWSSEDLFVLFEGGGEVTIRATMLAADLRRMQDEQQAQAVERRQVR